MIYVLYVVASNATVEINLYILGPEFKFLSLS